ncbi:hypothetical protein JI752_016075 [Lysobacter sp. MMG2]|uniref:hypothetical protein n=1 Tax=Lysobacter sp. MMG2 TaxID=2801338 RepID=UPI001C2433EE|nr:hypothetical protein [Lysobacter sp. MMG2]MBU8977667.1 hypothetical protein [Lysobacter sp. MMG2]
MRKERQVGQKAVAKLGLQMTCDGKPEAITDNAANANPAMRGDTLHKEPNGAVDFTLNRAQVLPLAGMEVQDVEVQADNRDPHPRDHRPGLNVRQGSTDEATRIGKTTKIGWHGRGAGVALTGVTSKDGKWGQIEAVTGESDFWGVPAAPAGHRGWVHLASLDAITRPGQFDAVVPLDPPHPIKQGDIVGYLGEDVPAHAHPIAGTPVSRRLLHLEVFSGDDVPGYLTASRQWAKQHVPDSERTLLVLRPGDALLDTPNRSLPPRSRHLNGESPAASNGGSHAQECFTESQIVAILKEADGFVPISLTLYCLLICN